VEPISTINLDPFAICKKTALQLLGSPKVGQRMLYHGWITVVREGGRGCTTIIDYQSLKLAYQRWLNGEEPPPLPSEVKIPGAK
jgi:hypothetical protein